MSRTYQRNGLATLVGQETGGNLNGINGGLVMWLELPNSKIEIDIPVGGQFFPEAQPNKGLDPDILVAPNVMDMVNGIDSEIEAILELVSAD